MMRMLLGELVNEMINVKTSSHKRLAEKIGKKNGSAIGNIVMRNNCTVDTLLDIAEALEYDIVFKPKGNFGSTLVLTKEDDKK
jgi:hypothetical protein